MQSDTHGSATHVCCGSWRCCGIGIRGWATPHFEAKEDVVYSRGRSTTHARGRSEWWGCRQGAAKVTSTDREVGCRPVLSGICSSTRTMARSTRSRRLPTSHDQEGRRSSPAHRAHGRPALGERAGSAILLVLVQRSARVDPDDGQGRSQISQTAMCSEWPLDGGLSRREGERVCSGGCNWPGRVRHPGASLGDCMLLIRSD